MNHRGKHRNTVGHLLLQVQPLSLIITLICYLYMKEFRHPQKRLQLGTLRE